MILRLENVAACLGHFGFQSLQCCGLNGHVQAAGNPGSRRRLRLAVWYFSRSTIIRPYILISTISNCLAAEFRQIIIDGKLRSDRTTGEIRQ